MPLSSTLPASDPARRRSLPQTTVRRRRSAAARWSVPTRGPMHATRGTARGGGPRSSSPAWQGSTRLGWVLLRRSRAGLLTSTCRRCRTRARWSTWVQQSRWSRYRSGPVGSPPEEHPGVRRVAQHGGGEDEDQTAGGCLGEPEHIGWGTDKWGVATGEHGGGYCHGGAGRDHQQRAGVTVAAVQQRRRGQARCV